MLIVVGFLLVLLVTAGTGYFVAQEFAYLTVDRGRLERLAAEGNAAAARAVRVTERLSYVLSGAQVGITVTSLLAGYLAEPYLGSGLRDVLGLPAAAAGPLAAAVALLVATVVQMVLGELAPKNLAIARPLPLALALSRTTLWYLTVAGPVIGVFDAAANRLVRLLGVEPVHELDGTVTAEDLTGIVAASRRGGRLDPRLAAELDRALTFPSRTAGRTMTARVDVRSLPADAPAARVVELLSTGYARFPVVRGGDPDDLLGVVGLSQVLAIPADDRDTVTVGALATPAVLVPASLPLPRVLDRLRAARQQLACVIDEYGGFAGIVTLEDVVEELVGDIRDEDDPAGPVLARRPDGSWLVPARLRPDELSAATGVWLTVARAYDTVGGLLMAELGRLPRPGDRIEVPSAEVRDPDEEATPAPTVELTVTRVHRRVPAELAVRLVPAGPEVAP
ncbi:hemolysin family protein [Actinocatenispora rupis]|uniref:Membrane protein n=1 Tax=Actinocatenispora rupis TaxID=519421 RepID=A0A8J3NFW3_9ACTN|nr:hemolysin family protein [Actinocatenispora rupis]GID14234.1 membrane protein [Actinocatenispora rupis]